MAYVEARPQMHRSAYSNQSLYPVPSRWNPKQQEVIVISDSPSPLPSPYHDGKDSRTRIEALTRQRRQNATDSLQIYGHPISNGNGYAPYPSYAQVIQDTRQANTMAGNMAHGGFYNSTQQLSLQQNGARPVFDYDAPYNRQYGNANNKRKRDDWEDESERSTYSRNVTYTAQSSASSRHTRIYQKSREVVLRKEVDYATERTDICWDDKEGHYKIVPKSQFTTRYQIDRLLGQGTFGKVVRAYDNRKRSWVAIKIIRAVQKYRDASMIELRVLRTLQENDPNNANNCIHLQDCFDFRNHVCIVTELLSESVFDFLKENSFAPFPKRHIQHFAHQLFASVAFLHDLDLIHTDLKPENILLVSNQSVVEPYDRRSPNLQSRKVLINSALRLIDFGSATFQDEYHSNVVSTRHYRAPEIILGMGWSFPCDVWSIGCILIEFYTGDALYQTHDNLEHLAMMEVVCGRIEGNLIRSCSKIAQKLFRPSGRLDWPNRETDKNSRRAVKQMRALQDMFPRTSAFNHHFSDLLRKIFVYDPAQRITAKEALQHPFLNPAYTAT